ncbi:MAG: hypothetical protein ACI9S8_001704 [Chlamydiales bacterium]|jgi:hypothetical protein
MTPPFDSFISLRVSTPQKEGKLQVSKWLQSQVLLDVSEMEALLEELGEAQLFSTGRLVEKGKSFVIKRDFLDCYIDYVESLKKGQLPDDSNFRSFFGSVFTVTPDVLYSMEIEDGRELVHPTRPVLQMQAHSIGYSVEEGKFRPMVLGKDSILWGIQFSYPQLFQDNETLSVEKVEETEKFPNTQLFRKLQRWVRHNTRATPFIIGDKKTNVPMRLGKKCFEWINKHPQLIKKGIKVDI